MEKMGSIQLVIISWLFITTTIITCAANNQSPDPPVQFIKRFRVDSKRQISNNQLDNANNVAAEAAPTTPCSLSVFRYLYNMPGEKYRPNLPAGTIVFGKPLPPLENRPNNNNNNNNNNGDFIQPSGSSINPNFQQGFHTNGPSFQGPVRPGYNQFPLPARASFQPTFTTAEPHPTEQTTITASSIPRQETVSDESGSRIDAPELPPKVEGSASAPNPNLNYLPPPPGNGYLPPVQNTNSQQSQNPSPSIRTHFYIPFESVTIGGGGPTTPSSPNELSATTPAPTTITPIIVTTPIPESPTTTIDFVRASPVPSSSNPQVQAIPHPQIAGFTSPQPCAYHQQPQQQPIGTLVKCICPDGRVFFIPATSNHAAPQFQQLQPFGTQIYPQFLSYPLAPVPNILNQQSVGLQPLLPVPVINDNILDFEHTPPTASPARLSSPTPGASPHALLVPSGTPSPAAEIPSHINQFSSHVPATPEPVPLTYQYQPAPFTFSNHYINPTFHPAPASFSNLSPTSPPTLNILPKFSPAQIQENRNNGYHNAAFAQSQDTNPPNNQQSTIAPSDFEGSTNNIDFQHHHHQQQHDTQKSFHESPTTISAQLQENSDLNDYQSTTPPVLQQDNRINGYQNSRPNFEEPGINNGYQSTATPFHEPPTIIPAQLHETRIIDYQNAITTSQADENRINDNNYINAPSQTNGYHFTTSPNSFYQPSHDPSQFHQNGINEYQSTSTPFNEGSTTATTAPITTPTPEINNFPRSRGYNYNRPAVAFSLPARGNDNGYNYKR